MRKIEKKNQNAWKTFTFDKHQKHRLAWMKYGLWKNRDNYNIRNYDQELFLQLVSKLALNSSDGKRNTLTRFKVNLETKVEHISLYSFWKKIKVLIKCSLLMKCFVEWKRVHSGNNFVFNVFEISDNKNLVNFIDRSEKRKIRYETASPSVISSEWFCFAKWYCTWCS